MNRIRIDLTSKKAETSSSPRAKPEAKLESRPRAKGKGGKRRIFSRFAVIGTLLFLFVVALLGSQLYALLRDTNFSFNPFRTITEALSGPELRQTEDGFTNFMIVGIDTRETYNLQNTDTIIAASYNHETGEAVLISIPRDLWVKYPADYSVYDRINGVYNFCEKAEEGTGLECLREVVSEITGLPIHYHGMIDLKGFTDAIDELGGIDVYVERSFTDYQYPGPSGNQVVHFDEGWQHMDGGTALQYARSRKAAGPEGSDFSRMKRQQKLVKAVADKALKIEGIDDLTEIYRVYNIFKENIKLSEFSDVDIMAAIKLSKSFDGEKIYGINLDPSVANSTLLYHPTDGTTGNAYSVIPREGLNRWNKIQEFLQAVTDNPRLYDENAKIYVYNGGIGFNEAAEMVEEMLDDNKYLKIIYGGNAAKQDYEGILVYDFSEEGRPATVELLANYLSANYEEETPEDLKNPYKEDIVVILGSEEGTASNPDDNSD